MNEFYLAEGMQVYCQDGKCGKLAKVAVDPDARQVKHLIVEEGFLLKSAHVFPFDLIIQSDTDGIHLAIEKDELTSYPEYQEHEVETPISESEHSTAHGPLAGIMPIDAAPKSVPVARESVRQGVSPMLAVIEKGTPIKNFQGTVGELDHVLVEPEDGRITRLVVKQGLLFSERRLLPVAMVDRIREREIVVSASEEELLDLLPYEQIFGSLEESVATRNGSVVQAEGQEEDPGRRVTAALMADPRTSEAVIEVIEERGVVTLKGQVDSPEVHQAAKDIAASQPGVITVVNSLEVTDQ